MADKVPVKATYDSAGDADGLAEYVSGDTLGYAHGGTGLSSLGSAGQLLRVNSSANAIEWGAAEVLNIDGMTDGSSITIADTDKFGISDGGTEKYVLASQIKTYVGPLSLRDEDDMFLQIEDKSEPYNQEFLNIYLTSLLKQHLNSKEYHVLRLSYGLDCDKHSAKEIAKYLGIEGSSSYVRVSQLKKQAVDTLIENVDHSQVIDFL